MPSLVWYRSLYWRIAIGFVALLAVLLGVQGLVFLWLTGQVAAFWPGRSASELASSIASDVSQAVSANPKLDLNTYVNNRYQSAFRSFAVVMRDGRVVLSRRVVPPRDIERAARMRLYGDAIPPPWFGRRDGPPPDRESLPPGRDGAPPDRGRSAPPGGDFGRRGFGRGDFDGRGFGGRGRFDPRGPSLEFATVVIAGNDAGVVAVPVETPPLSVAMRDLGRPLGFVALGLLVAGTAVGALLVFRPTHRRLRSLQDAAIALGAGDTSVRAQESGGDEVAALARSFNEMAEQLEQRTRALETADRTRRQLLADVSHELTTPLAAVKGYVETLAMPDLQLDAATRARYLGIVTEEAERLEHIVGDLLDLAKLEGGGGAFKVDDVSVAQLFDRVRNRHEANVGERQIDLLTVGAGTLVVIGDAIRLEQALQNLVSNALRHTPSGGRVVVSADRVDGDVRIRVQDTGPGIPEEHLPHVFDRFYKVDVSRAGTEVPSGSGLGLSIVQAIVARHGGRVTAGNAPEGGARFEILLPAR